MKPTTPLPLLASMLMAWSTSAPGQSTSTLQAFGATAGLGPEQVAVVVNEEDPASVALAEHYRLVRKIPAGNLVRVRIPGSPRRLTAAQFADLRRQLDAQLAADIQVLALAWTAPYAVDCQSITAALALGFEPGLCERTCAPSRASPYFDSNSQRPYTDLGIRLAMLLPSEPAGLGEQLIERGWHADRSRPAADAYFLITSDTARNSRVRFFPPSSHLAGSELNIHTIRAEQIEYRHDIMVYETGAVRVDKLETLSFLPGALADHLTSAGGDLLGDGQMSALRWLEAGATATYGTVSEPCNYWQKFPNPQILLKHYLRGETAVEAYWKSVAWPAQGVFVGEPLAAPYRR